MVPVILFGKGNLLNITIINSYTMAVRDFADICTQSPRATGVYVSKIPSSRGISDMYHLGCTYLIGEKTSYPLVHFFYRVTITNQSWV